MIREGRKLPNNVRERVPVIVDKVSRDGDVAALYAFGSIARGVLKPLSDLDFGILLSMRLGRRQRFDKHLDLIGAFNDTFETDEVDLVVMNDAPLRFSYNIIRTGCFCQGPGRPLARFSCKIKSFREVRNAFFIWPLKAASTSATEG